jgi:hypothetical protein
MRKEARKRMLKELKKTMHDDMYEGMDEKMKGMKKVTVSSDSEKGLKEGLSKAQEIMQKRKEMKDDDYKDGGYKSSKEGEGYERGYKDSPEYSRKKPAYLSDAKKRKTGKYNMGGYKKNK